MRNKWIPTILICTLVVLSLACASGAPTSAPPSAPSEISPATSTPNVQATVDAALAATAQNQSNLQSTVGAAVASTVVALPPTATPIPPVEYVAMTEEEMEALIDEAVNEAVAATTQASTATTQTTSDDSLTYDEVQYVQVYVSAAEQAVYYAEELLAAYSQIYGDLAYAALAEVEQIEQELVYMADSIAALDSTLQEVNDTLQAGQAIAAETITQLETAAQTASSNLSQTQAQVQTWQDKTQQDRDNRINEISAIQPDHVPADLQATLQEAFSFVDQVRGALGDNKFSREELNGIAQLGANVSAGFNNHGGPKMQDMSGRLNEITMQLARGQLPQARSGVGNFETSLGQRPSGGGFTPPQGPGVQPPRPGRP
jgi:hypothetical protein